MSVDDLSSMLHSLRDDLIARVEARARTRQVETTTACAETQEILTEELEERLRKHWPRKGRTEVITNVFVEFSVAVSCAVPIVSISMYRFSFSQVQFLIKHDTCAYAGGVETTSARLSLTRKRARDERLEDVKWEWPSRGGV